MMVLQPRDRGGGAIGSPLIETPGEAAASGAGIGGGVGDQGSDGFALKNSVSFAVVIAHSVFGAVILLTVGCCGWWSGICDPSVLGSPQLR